jgi:hypothetical protein|eukprot:COSAG01_NODE_10283_length_2200_cov_65.138030_3_plen_218_part_00
MSLTLNLDFDAVTPPQTTRLTSVVVRSVSSDYCDARRRAGYRCVPTRESTAGGAFQLAARWPVCMGVPSPDRRVPVSVPGRAGAGAEALAEATAGAACREPDASSSSLSSTPSTIDIRSAARPGCGATATGEGLQECRNSQRRRAEEQAMEQDPPASPPSSPSPGNTLNRPRGRIPTPSGEPITERRRSGIGRHAPSGDGRGRHWSRRKADLCPRRE